MSEATLKRKTAAKYNNNSVGTGFYLNGGHRSQGWIGQDTLGRSLPKTPMKGNVVKGHGGCCGTYQQKEIVNSAVNSLNNPNIMKRSVLSNDGMICTKYRWIWRPQPYSTTKQDTWHTTCSQTEYISNLSVAVVNQIDISYSDTFEINTPMICCPYLPKSARPKPSINPQIIQTRNPGNYTKTNMTRPENNNPLLGILGGGYINYIKNQSTYIQYLNKTCITDISLNLNINCYQVPQIQNILQTPLIAGTRSYGT